MSWSTPLTAAANAPLTASQWNASVRDDLLETAPAKATTAGAIFVATGTNAIAQRIPSSTFTSATETTTNTSYVDLATSGPAVTVTSGTQVLIAVGGHMWNDTAGGRSWMAFAVSGASSVSASDTTAYTHDISANGRIIGASRVVLQGSLTAGSNTFTAKYRVTSGTGSWAQRNLVVVPF